jgi:hypothetical protein
MKTGTVALLGLGALGLTAVVVGVLTSREAAAEEEPPIPIPPEEEEIIDAELRHGHVWWAGETAWKDIHTRYPNSWPADTDITLAWKIKNTGNVGAYFQVYLFEPGDWFYLEPGDETQVFEEVHTQAVPVMPGYQYCRIMILGRKVTGERIGAVWASEDFEVTYV